MKVNTQVNKSRAQHCATQLRPALPRRHSEQLDSFHRQGGGHGRPSMYRRHSAPRSPLAHARAVPAKVAPKASKATRPALAAMVGVMFGARFETFATTVVDITLRFAEWTLNLAIEVAMDRVGQRFGRHASLSAVRI